MNKVHPKDVLLNRWPRCIWSKWQEVLHHHILLWQQLTPKHSYNNSVCRLFPSSYWTILKMSGTIHLFMVSKQIFDFFCILIFFIVFVCNTIVKEILRAWQQKLILSKICKYIQISGENNIKKWTLHHSEAFIVCAWIKRVADPPNIPVFETWPNLNSSGNWPCWEFPE